MVKSKFPDVEIPDVPLHYVIFSKWEEMKDRPILVDGISGTIYTFAEVRKLACNIASVLSSKGLKKGDVLALVCHNCPEFALMLYGCMFLGVTVTTVNPIYTVYELSHQIEDSGATYLFASDDIAEKAKKAGLQTGQIKEIFVSGSALGCTPFHHFTEYSGPEFNPFSVQFNPAEDVVFMPYSSGTTGLPKGVLMTHRNVVAMVVQVSADAFRDVNQDPSIQLRTLGILPFYHSYGLLLVLCRAIAGGTMVVTLPKFTPETFMDATEKYKITNFTLVPPLVLFLVNNPIVKKYDLSSVRRIGSGAAPLSRDKEEKLQQSFNQTIVRQGYGMTETSPVALTHPAQFKPKPGSVGVVVPNTEVKIVDPDTGRELGPNQRGELWVRGPQVTTKGYKNRPEDTRMTFDSNGWLHTGDIGYYDEDEYFYIVDRIKELIKVKGMQVAPAELEALLLTHPGVYEVGVTSIPDERAGELPMAYVVKKPNANLTEVDMLNYVAERAAPYKHLKGGVEFVDEIPKLTSGKILSKERMKYYSHARKARQHPDKYLSVIIDGMDQAKTNLPHFSAPSKQVQSMWKLRTHLTGVIVHGHGVYGYFDCCQYPHSSNLTINILLNILYMYRDSLPDVLYLQLDNCGRENKNRFVFGFCALLVQLGLFRKVKVSFLMKGHTHEDIDQLFSRFATCLRRNDAQTLETLAESFEKSYTPRPTAIVLEDLPDISAWIEPSIVDLAFHSQPHQFKFVRDDNGKAVMFTKKWSTDAAWMKCDGPVGGRILTELPTGRPQLMRPDFCRHQDLDRLAEDVKNASKFMSGEANRWWGDWLREHQAHSRERFDRDGEYDWRLPDLITASAGGQHGAAPAPATCDSVCSVARNDIDNALSDEEAPIRPVRAGEKLKKRLKKYNVQKELEVGDMCLLDCPQWHEYWPLLGQVMEVKECGTRVDIRWWRQADNGVMVPEDRDKDGNPGDWREVVGRMQIYHHGFSLTPTGRLAATERQRIRQYEEDE